MEKEYEKGTFGYDLNYLSEKDSLIVLKSDDEKALDMIKALIGHLTAEGKTWKVVRRDDAVRSLKIAQAAIEGVKLATSK